MYVRSGYLCLCIVAAAAGFAGCSSETLGTRTTASCPEYMEMQTAEQDGIATELIADSRQSEPEPFTIGMVRSSLQFFCSNPANESADVGDLVLPAEALPANGSQ